MLPFQIVEPGAYKLERAVDKTEKDIRIYGSEVIVVDCPFAEISSFNVDESHFCQGETAALNIFVNGVPPLHLTYS